MILLDTKAANEPKNTQEYTSKGIQWQVLFYTSACKLGYPNLEH